MKEVTCVICEKNDTKLHAVNNNFSLVKCLHDGLVYVNPQPDNSDFQEFYGAKEYFLRSETATIGYSDYLADQPAIIKNSCRVFDELVKFCSVGKVLDIGCAFGFALQVAQKYGFEAHGNDLNEHAITYAREKLHIENVKVGCVTDLPYQNESFDVVLMLGTIEHFQNPREETQAAYRLLKPGGLLAIVTVDFDSLVGRGTIRPPEHLYYFSARTMDTFLQVNGFKVLKMAPQYGFNIFYFTIEDFATRLFDYFYRLTENTKFKKTLFFLKSTTLKFVKKIGIGSQVIPGIDGQFLTIAKRL
ncbi:methyltransferase domain-containing protein [Candidatus Parcubacteria bacterium]|nr:methyltransferase domain-containing protein [Candidatus Parcubacteria bacterium]